MSTLSDVLDAYKAYKAADEAADASFDLADFPDLPARPTYTPSVAAGELITTRGIRGALVVLLDEAIGGNIGEFRREVAKRVMWAALDEENTDGRE